MKELIDGWKDTLQQYRLRILYVVGVSLLFISLAGWALLPDEVSLMAESIGSPLMPKNSALMANIALVGVFSTLFTWKPREIVYFVAMALALLLSTIPLLTMVTAV